MADPGCRNYAYDSGILIKITQEILARVNLKVCIFPRLGLSLAFFIYIYTYVGNVVAGEAIIEATLDNDLLLLFFPGNIHKSCTAANVFSSQNKYGLFSMKLEPIMKV